MQSIDSYGGNDLLYLNSRGTIPAAAIFKKGEKRTKPFKDRKQFDATGFDRINKIDAFEEEEDDTIMDKARLADMEG
jgi:tRNA pseudouridine38-40 synthase